MRCGVFFEKGDHKRIPGWMQVHYRMSFDEKGIPMLYVFQNCRGFIRTMPMLTYDRVNPEDLDTNGEDHLADEVRYLCMEHPIAPKPVQVKKALAYNPVSYTHLDVYKRQIQKRHKKHPFLGEVN